jgi:N utilization substance protein B
VLQALYRYRITGSWESPAQIQASFGASTLDDSGLDAEEDAPFAALLYQSLTERLDEIDSLIEGASRNWRLDRMAALDHCVLRLATAELLARTAPVRVVLNEAVELARTFGADSSPAFVNGVLDGVMKALNKDQKG